MATEDEIFAIIVKTEGEEKVKTLAAAASLAEQKFEALYSTLGKGHTSTTAAASAMLDAQKTLKQAGDAAGMSTHQFMNLGRTIDDLQYVPEQGLRPIINNVMEMSPAVGIAMIAFQLLYTHADKLKELFGTGSTKTEAERMDELGKATKRTAGEEREYQTLKERAKHAEAQNKPADKVTERKDAIDKAIANGPVADVEKDVDRIFGDHIKKMADSALDSSGQAPGERDPRKLQDNIAKRREQLAAGNLGIEGDQIAATDIARDQKALEAVAGAYADARKKFMADLGNDDQAGNVKRLAQGASNPLTRAALLEAQKTAEQREEEKDQADSDKEVMDRGSRLAEWENKGLVDQDAIDAQDQADSDKEVMDRTSRLAAFEERNRVADRDRAIEDAKKAQAAGERVGGAIMDHAESVRDIYAKAAEAQRGGPSQVIDSAGLAASIQGGVGGKDPAMETVSELQKANETLLKVLNKPVNQVARAG